MRAIEDSKRPLLAMLESGVPKRTCCVWTDETQRAVYASNALRALLVPGKLLHYSARKQVRQDLVTVGNRLLDA
jgi:hypothetical protein